MAKNRYVNTGFWDDDYTGNLDPSEKLLFLYFLTNPLTNIHGVYQIQLRRVSFDTGYDQEMVKKILGRFERDGKVYYEIGWIVLKNFLRHQTLNPSTKTAVITHFNSLPEELRKKLLDPVDNLFIDYKAILTACIQPGDMLSTNPNQNPNLNMNFNPNQNPNGRAAAEASTRPGENRGGSKNLEEERKNLYGRKGMR